MSKMIIRSVSLMAVVTIGAAACSSDSTTESTDSGVASLSDQSSTTSQGSTDGVGAEDSEAPTDPDLAYALFESCMTDEGFDFSIASGSTDATDIDELGVEEVDPQGQAFGSPEELNERFAEAEEKCDRHLANVENQQDLSPEEQAEFEDAQIAFADCMREKGIDIPDFDGDGGGVIVIEAGPGENDPQGGGFDPDNFDTEAFDEAADECNAVFDSLNESISGGAEE